MNDYYQSHITCNCVVIDDYIAVTAGQNKQHETAKNVAKLDRETEELHHDTIGLDVGRLIQQGRQAKGLTQKELATVSKSKVKLDTVTYIPLFCIFWRSFRCSSRGVLGALLGESGSSGSCVCTGWTEVVSEW